MLVAVLMECRDLDGQTIEEIALLSEEELTSRLDEMHKKLAELIEQEQQEIEQAALENSPTTSDGETATDESAGVIPAGT